MNARYRDERVAGSWLWDTRVLRIGTMSRHVQSAIGAPIQQVLLADQIGVSPSRAWFMRSDACIVEMMLRPLLVKEGHGMGERAGV